MSYLRKAMGAAGNVLLGVGGGYLFNAAKPYVKELRGTGAYNAKTHFGDMSFHEGVNTAFDGVKKFAHSDFMQKRAPMVASGVMDAATVIKDRLSGGYKDMVN